MSIPITPNLAVSADDDRVRHTTIALVLRHCAGSIVTVSTRSHLDGVTLTVADPDPAHQPDVVLPVIAHDAILQMHIW